MEFSKQEARIAEIIYRSVPIDFSLYCPNCDHEWVPSRCPKCRHKIYEFGWRSGTFLAIINGHKIDSWVKLVREIIKEVLNEGDKNPTTTT